MRPHPLAREQVRAALALQASTTLIDHVLAAATARASAAVGMPIADAMAVARAARNRADAFSCERLYRALGGLGALMLMGCASAAEARFGTRAKWRQTETGAAVVALLRRVALVLEAYNARKRRGTESGACAPQTPGCVATLQDLAASAFVEASGASPALLQAFEDALARPRLFQVAGTGGARASFWEAAETVYLHRAQQCGHCDSAQRAAAVVASAVAFADAASVGHTIALTPAFFQARAAVMAEWVPCSNFYGREWQSSERKAATKLRHTGRCDAEVGEALGFRMEWAAFLDGARHSFAQVERTDEKRRHACAWRSPCTRAPRSPRAATPRCLRRWAQDCTRCTRPRSSARPSVWWAAPRRHAC